jgi:beta-glucosidase
MRHSRTIALVALDVENTGSRAGDEIVQLYVNDEVTSIVYYERVLRGFERVSLKPGERARVRFTLTPDDLKLLDRDMKWTVEPGVFQVLVGASSEDIRLRGAFEIRQGDQANPALFMMPAMS